MRRVPKYPRALEAKQEVPGGTGSGGVLRLGQLSRYNQINEGRYTVGFTAGGAVPG